MSSSQETLASATTSLFTDVKQKEPQQTCTLADVIDTVRSDVYKPEIEEIRQLVKDGRHNDAGRRKHLLPAVSTSVITNRRDSSLPADERFGPHNGVLQIDLDGKDNPQLESDYNAVVEAVKQDEHVIAGFRSPSGNGLKLFVAIRASKTAHKLSWIAAQSHFAKTYGLKIDRATSDVGRLCFLSYDPDAFVCDHDPVALPPAESDLEEIPVPTTRTMVSEREDIEKMLSYINYRPDYPDWIRIASAVWNTLGEAEGTALLQRYIPEEKRGEYERKYKKRLTTITLGTLVYYASLNGYDIREECSKRRWAGRIYFGRRGTIVTNDIADVRADDVQAEVEEFHPVEITAHFIDDCLADGQRGDAHLFATLNKGTFAYDRIVKHWRIYIDGIWQSDLGNTTTLALSECLTNVYQERIRQLELDSKGREEEDPVIKVNAAQIKRLRKRVENLCNLKYMDNVTKIASFRMQSDMSEYDKNPYLLVTQNKTLDLKILEARPHSPKDLMTKKIPVVFDVDATCPKWEEFVDQIFCHDQSLVNYVQRVIGYCLSGLTTEDNMFFLVGGGSNGKSTFQSAVNMLFSDLACSIRIKTLLSNASDSNVDYQKARLKGCRIAWTDEVPNGQRFNESEIKAMVGGDRIVARAPFQLPSEFDPTHKLFPIGNHIPTITGTDHGIWRRIQLIPFNATFSVTDPEHKTRSRQEILSDLKAELPGILNWALKGWLDYCVRGLSDKPECITRVTGEYRASQDVVGNFLSESYAEDPDFGKIKFADVFQDYITWCKESNEPYHNITKRYFARVLRDRGIEIKLSTGGMMYVYGYSKSTTNGLFTSRIAPAIK